MRVLVFGRVGQVGSALTELLPLQHEAVFLDQPQVDLAEPASLRQHVLDWHPEIVINAAAYTSVDRAESEPDLVHAINADAPQVMAAACKEIDAIFLHYSTDYVFDGTASKSYTEADEVGPRSIYGKSKLVGEEAIAAVTDRHLILRTAWLYSHIGHNFLKTMLRLADSQTEIRVVADQYGSPTYAWDLATVTVAMVDVLADGYEDGFGVYHATNTGVTSWHGFAEKILALIGRVDVTVQPIATVEYPTAAPRPSYSALSCNRLHQVYGLTLPNWQDAVARCLMRCQSENLDRGTGFCDIARD